MKVAPTRPTLTRSGAYWHLSDCDGSTAWQCLDYLIDCIDRQRLKRQTVELRAYSLKTWLTYLAAKRTDLMDATDFDLVEFAQHHATRFSTQAFGDEQARRRSANQVLRCIYLFYAWLQLSPHGAGLRLFGPAGCQITSTLNLTGRQKGRTNYPATHRHAGERSKHRRRYVPDEAMRRRVIAYFYARYPEAIAQRNALILDFALNVGWRRGSIVSLTVDQFLGVKDAQDGALITPPDQKFGYTLAFSVDSALMSRALAYVLGHRADIVRRTGSSSIQLLLSERSGTPLSAAAVTRIFADARKALQIPIGNGVHSWRRAFAIRTMHREIERRNKLGLNVPFTDIAAVVANRLGHESLHAQEAYIRGHGVPKILEAADDVQGE
ncbi:TPA: hypothetical protein QEK98_000224 [Stenotrophomonas maltophilia]|nr:hypothetical protein [Stenotrophomonas maltophilia]